MDNFSLECAISDIKRLSDDLQFYLNQNDRANIIRLSSHILYCVSDILEYTLPDGVKITIK